MLKLIIGNKNYSSWSLRPWFLLRQAGIDFEEILIPLYQGDYKQQLLRHSPSGKVPCLLDEAVAVWDSLAIAEYLAERFPSLNLWQQDVAQRAEARSISAEMHAGFSALRSHFGMNLRYRHDTPVPAEVAPEIERIVEIWSSCRQRFGDKGPFLFGQFSIADAMFVPVCCRFRSYGVKLPADCANYVEHMLNLPAMTDWYAGAAAETWVIDKLEPQRGAQP